MNNFDVITDEWKKQEDARFFVNHLKAMAEDRKNEILYTRHETVEQVGIHTLRNAAYIDALNDIINLFGDKK